LDLARLDHKQQQHNLTIYLVHHKINNRVSLVKPINQQLQQQASLAVVVVQQTLVVVYLALKLIDPRFLHLVRVQQLHKPHHRSLSIQQLKQPAQHRQYLVIINKQPCRINHSVLHHLEVQL
jgi:hypothetical protein